MARDYRYGPGQKPGYQRKSQQTQAVPEKSSSGKPLTTKKFIWLVVGLSLVLALAFYVTNHFKQHGPKNQWSQAELTDQAVSEEQVFISTAKQQPVEIMPEEDLVEPTTDVALPSTSFRFYEDLPRLATVTDVEPLPVQLPDPMWIQAGSFRRLEQAQREQQRLSTEERVMQIAPIETENGKFYRIVLGPFTDRLELNRHRNALRRLGADTRVVQVAPERLINN
ncbi:SPOR domain-containing protein [Thiomicrospira sp. ALE5]|uniref:SPOR domain-containing protein n=1 Tax=Thiomicrospira sp. ALE5 TaxID=748650 RepID=UPI0008EFD05B|nr:SPOR domain-containing protein [Thiomicrospira sp. ALE5]SFR55098.1 Sporulation related domain-containing protein [Thiomicrospira sp. ALE5]